MNMKMLSKLSVVIIPAIIMVRYSFIQDLSVTGLSFDGKYLHVSGMFKVQLTEEAWTEFGYQDGDFYWFNEWWQEQVGNRYRHFALMSIEWTVLEHTETHHKLGFTLILEPKAYIQTEKPPNPSHPPHRHRHR